MKKLCPNCGKAIDPEAKYCPYCHFNLMNNDETIITVDKKVLNKSDKPISNIKRWLLPILLVVAFLAVLLGIGSHYYSHQEQLIRLEADLKNGKTKNLTTNSKFTLNANNVRPLKEYYQNNPAAYQSLKKKLAGKNDGPIRLTTQGKYFLIFPRYVLQLPVYNLTVNNSYQHATVYVNGQKYSQKMQVLPGQYQIKTKLSYLGQKTEQIQTINVLENKQTSIAGLNVGSFKVRSTPYGRIYLNNKFVGKLNSRGTIAFNDVPLNRAFSIYVAKNYHGRLIKTKKIADVPAIIKSKKTAPTLKLAWQGSTNLKDLLEKSFNTPQASNFVGGSKNRSYRDLRQLNRSWRKSPNLKSYTAKITVQKKSLSNLHYRVKYTFNFKSGKRKQIMRYSGGVIQKTKDGLKIKSIGSGSIVKSK